MKLLPLLVLFAAAGSTTIPSDAPIGISVTISRYFDPLARRPLDPDIVPLKCEALILTTLPEHPRVVISHADVQLIAGEKRSTKARQSPTRTDLTCDVAPDGHSAKTAVTFYRDGKIAAQQMTDIWLPEVKRR